MLYGLNTTSQYNKDFGLTVITKSCFQDFNLDPAINWVKVHIDLSFKRVKHFSKEKNMGLNVRKPDVVACQQQRRRPACAFTKSDQCLCYSLSSKYNNLACYTQKIIILAMPLLFPLA